MNTQDTEQTFGQPNEPSEVASSDVVGAQLEDRSPVDFGSVSGDGLETTMRAARYEPTAFQELHFVDLDDSIDVRAEGESHEKDSVVKGRKSSRGNKP